ncbi:sulfatase-like hydrolase/transferase [Frigidibacter sp. ROC022]|uniref:sulfatase-like hydrolase/transferase n=1 Tax=Frigidibacter sp. ROC022 TaxID=2971796 RepID=UPI00215A9F62|nr:sulfatase-like hydrolase/transferase [Frigidibacter sp. ROC022]MCR8726012.1 sulfatase-like hydrolase/transferase [Frigidibacter sp. ROC022]
MAERPNILFLFSDQHAQRVAGCYGDGIAETPALDGLAAAGVTFDACHTPSPICGPARMSMLTGREPNDTRVWTNNDMLPSDMPTYAHALTAAGYETISIGRLHALGPDQHRGFTTRLVGDHSPNWPGVARHDMGVLSKTHGPNRVSVERSGRGNSAYQSLDEATLEAALAQLDQLGERRQAGDAAPFFLQVGFMLPHPPYVARPEDYDRFEGRVPPAAIPAPDDPHPWVDWWRRVRGVADVTKAEAARSRAAYYALVRRMDLHIGRILDRLAALGLSEDTLVVYASDHGDHIGERGLWWKHTMYDDSVKVPLLLRWPGRIPAGARRGENVGLLNVTAAFLEAAGAPPLPNSSADSLLSLARGTAEDWADTVVSEYCANPEEAYSGGRWTLQRMVRTGPWKYIWHDGFPEQLFDMQADPEERHDLAGDPGQSDRLAQFRDRALAGWNPEAIRAAMAARARDRELLCRWAGAAPPRDALRWEFPPDINRLDG